MTMSVAATSAPAARSAAESGRGFEDEVHVLGVVHALEVLARRFRRFAQQQARGETRRLERLQHRLQPQRRLRVALSHLMLDAIGMREEGGRHAAILVLSSNAPADDTVTR